MQVSRPLQMVGAVDSMPEVDESMARDFTDIGLLTERRRTGYLTDI